jgi:glycosyltransferase involved in cell wall biosynthesis
MRIALWHNLPTGGGLRVLDGHVRGLVERGHEVTVWAPPTAARCDALELAAARHVVPFALTRTPNRRDEFLTAWRGRRPDLDAFAEHSARCAQEIEATKPDLVFAHSCQYFRVPAIATFLGTPSVLYLHEPNRALYEAPFGSPWAEEPTPRSGVRPASVRAFVHDLVRVENARLQVRAETHWVHAFDEVLVNSLFTREGVLRAYDRLSRVCRPGIDTDRFTFHERPRSMRGNVLMVGALVGEKNPLFLVRAVAAARPAVNRFTWVANYAGSYRNRVEQAASAAGTPLDLRVAVSESTLMRAYAEADLFVYAPRLEPLGLAPLEANATGLPVLAVPEGGVRETIFDGVNGVFVEHDEEQFGAAIVRLLDDADRIRTLGRMARSHVEREWRLDDSIDRLEHSLTQVATRGR